MITEKQALALLEKYKLPDKIVEHCKAVSGKAGEVSERINAHGKAKVDCQKMRVAGLLHDIGKINFLKEDGKEENTIERHELESGRILEREGLPEIADIVARHGICAVIDSPVELTLEQKIIIYADANVVEDKRCSLKERYEYLIEKYGRGGRKENPIMFNLIKENWYKVDKLVNDVERLM